MNAKFIHISDLHLNLRDVDYTVNSIDEKRKKSIEIFDNVIERCFIEAIDFLLITGDLFDNNYYPAELYNYVVNQFESIPETKIYISPGNHDTTEKMYIYKYGMLPKNVHVFANCNNIQSVEAKDNINIIGADYNYNINKEDIEDILIESRDKFNILMLHSPLKDRVSKEHYYSKVEELLENLPLNYCAFGYEHTFTGFISIDNCTAAHPGSPYGIEDTKSNRGYIIGTIEDGILDVTFEITERMNIEKDRELNADRIKEEKEHKKDSSENSTKNSKEITKNIEEESIEILKKHFKTLKMSDNELMDYIRSKVKFSADVNDFIVESFYGESFHDDYYAETTVKKLLKITPEELVNFKSVGELIFKKEIEQEEYRDIFYMPENKMYFCIDSWLDFE